MLDGLITDTFKLPNNKFGAMDSNGSYSLFETKKKSLLYKSQCVSDLGLYSTDRNIQGAETFFINHMTRHDKLISGNSAFHFNKPGIYPEVIYFDLKRYYPTIFTQIANHINQGYFGKYRKFSKIGRRIELNKLSGRGLKLSEGASVKPIVSINDLAKNSIAIDSADNSGMISKIQGLSTGQFIDEADMRVSKITRNALCFGLGYKQKNAKINNVCALTMFFAREVLRHSIEQLRQNHNIIYSHTDSFMVEHLNTRELDDAIRTASGIVDNEFFGNTEIISLNLNNVQIKAKWEDVMIFNQNMYIGSTIAPQGKRDIHLKLAGVHTTSTCSMGITQKGESIQETLNNHYGELFSDKQISGGIDNDYIFGLLNLRISPEYELKLERAWRNNDEKFYGRKAVSISQTVKNINHLKRYNATNR